MMPLLFDLAKYFAVSTSIQLMYVTFAVVTKLDLLLIPYYFVLVLLELYIGKVYQGVPFPDGTLGIILIFSLPVLIVSAFIALTVWWVKYFMKYFKKALR